MRTKVMKVPQEWLEKAKNKSWFYSNYLKKIKGEPVKLEPHSLELLKIIKNEESV